VSITLELKHIFENAQDDPLTLESEAPDAFEKFCADAELAAALGGRSGHQHVSNFRTETSQLDKDLAAHYRQLASEAEKKSAPAPASDELRKRFGGSEKTIFRKFFAEQRAMGVSVSAILDRFTDDARREFAGILQELCEEFEAVA
jgi:hypothetical protein